MYKAFRRAAVGAAMATALGAGPALAAAPATTTQTFTTPGASMFTVPAGVSSITITAIGAAGGSCGVAGGEGEGATVTGTFAVTAGEQLAVGVAGPGDACAMAGGTGDGGVGGGGGSPTVGSGGGGGGASAVGGAGLPAYGNGNLLIVAGGGGGTAGGGLVQGGNAGSPGKFGPMSTGGGAGTATAGGAGGSDLLGGANGLPGGFAFGGDGGSGDTYNGGGGGGGYYGGGGGGGSLEPPASGGGGGSSFLAASATNTSGPTPTTDAASVTISYQSPAEPALTLSSQALTFMRHQLLRTVSAAQTLMVTNSGAAPLEVTGIQLAGADPGDFLASDLCQQPVAPGSTCTVSVRFAPLARGSRTATLTVLSNAPTAAAPVTLTGTGGLFARAAVRRHVKPVRRARRSGRHSQRGRHSSHRTLRAS